MESYILRLYRRGNGDKDKVAGLLEGVDKGSQYSFRSFEELRELLQSEVSVDIIGSPTKHNFQSE